MSISGELRSYIDRMRETNAADLILTAGQPPIIRITGALLPIEGRPKLSPEDVERLANGIMSEDQKLVFARDMELDASFGIPGVARFRVNIFRQQGSVGVAIRMLPHAIPKMENLGLPEILKRWLMVPHGIIIMTGPTGSGKSTSQAAMIGYLNQVRHDHIITIEDPIEFTHTHGTCTIEQREVGKDTHAFSAALKHVFRQAPDVIMIGEMRDRETFETALQLAETGHLVLATLHTGDTTQSISRIIDVFPEGQHQQIRVQLSAAIIGIVAQQLVPRVDGSSRMLSTEILEANNAVRNLIRKNELQQIYSVIQTSSREGMYTMNSSLLRLFIEGAVSLEQARLFTTRLKEFDQLVARKARIPSGIEDESKKELAVANR